MAFDLTLTDPKHVYMNKIYTITVALLAAMMFFAACGNAGAQNDKKTDNAPKAVKELDAESFTKQVFDMGSEDLLFLGDKPAIVDFTASWCGPCKRIAPILEELAKEYDGEIVIYKVDVDQNKPLAKSFEVSSIPAVMFIPIDGEPVMTIGSRDKAKFQEQINTILLGK